jgi:G3E family GTPase
MSIHSLPPDDAEKLRSWLPSEGQLENDTDTAVVAIEAATFLGLMESPGLATEDEDSPAAETIDRLEESHLIILHGERVSRLLALPMLKALAPQSAILQFDTLQQVDGWPLARLAAAAQRQDAAFPGPPGPGRHLYQARRPFHPERLEDLLLDLPRGLLRAAGYLWLAPGLDHAAELHLRGPDLHIVDGGLWLVAARIAGHCFDPYTQDYAASFIAGPWGDRRQDILFIGPELDFASLRKRLDSCLLTDREMDAGPAAWEDYADPFNFKNICRGE